VCIKNDITHQFIKQKLLCIYEEGYLKDRKRGRVDNAIEDELK
jgi:hypothetical protein